MNEVSAPSTIDQKMAEMRLKNLELLKRHQEIEADRQLAVRTGATTTIGETTKHNRAMRGTTKNRVRLTPSEPNAQENQPERSQRQPTRRKFESARSDAPPPRAQRIDYNRLKREHAQEINGQKPTNTTNTINQQLHQYAYPFQSQSENNNDADEPALAKRLVVVNNKVDRIGSGRFSQQQRTQEHGQRKREERMRRCTAQNNGHTASSTNEFHLDVPPMPMWQNSPMHIQLLPAHHTAIDNLINTSGEQLDQPAYIHNFVYPPPAQASPFNSNGTVYFAHPAPSATQPPIPQTHFHQYHSTHTYENANHHHQFHLPSFQAAPLFQPVPPPGPATSNTHQSHDTSPTEFQPRYRHPKPSDYDKKFSHPRPMSGDFERLHNTHQPSSRFNNDNRSQARPQSFYDFSPNSISNNNNNNNNFFRSFNNARFPRTNNNNNSHNNNTSLPLSAYMNTDDSFNENETINNNNHHWGTSYQRRRSTQQLQAQQQQPPPLRTYHQDKHQFPLSSYDPRQYGFHNNYQRRNNFNNGAGANRRGASNNRPNSNDVPNANEIDLIEEWWEDNNTDCSETNTEPKAAPTSMTVDDSGNSSLSTSMHLKESISDDSSTNDLMNPPSDVSTTDSHIIESLDKLQQQLKLEEAVDERLASATTEINDDREAKEPTTYDTAHFMQWAKEKFREELAGRLTAQEIEQHDAVTTDDDDDHQPTANDLEPMDALEDDLHEKLTIEEKQTSQQPSIAVE